MTTIDQPDLTNKTVVVLGGTGNLGVEITRSFLAAGARVIVPSRNAGKLAELRRDVGDLDSRFQGFEGEVTSSPGADAFAAHLADSGTAVDHVVAALGGFFYGKPLWEVSDQEWDDYFLEVIRTHISGARVLAPLLPPEGSYTILNGATASHSALTSPMNVLGSAQLGLRAALSADLGDRTRVNTLALGAVLTRVRTEGPDNALRATDIGKLCVGIATSRITGEDVVVHTRDELDGVLNSRT